MAFFPSRSRWIRHRIWIYSVVYSPSPLLLLFPLFNRGNSRIKLILCICFSLSVTFLSTIWWFGSFRIFYSPFYFFYIPFSYKCHAWEKKNYSIIWCVSVQWTTLASFVCAVCVVAVACWSDLPLERWRCPQCTSNISNQFNWRCARLLRRPFQRCIKNG